MKQVIHPLTLMSFMLVYSFLIFFWFRFLVMFTTKKFEFFLYFRFVFFFIFIFIFLKSPNFCFVCEDFSDDMKDIVNGLLGAKRNAFLKLICFFYYKDESKLKQVCKECMCISLIESYIE
jgi:hypothetical protein